VNQKADSLAMVVNDYVEFKKDDKKFLKYIEKKKEKKDAEQGTADESSK
jgi:hypothetical protein